MSVSYIHHQFPRVFPGSTTLQRGSWSRAGARRSQGKALAKDLRNGHLASAVHRRQVALRCAAAASASQGCALAKRWGIQQATCRPERVRPTAEVERAQVAVEDLSIITYLEND